MRTHSSRGVTLIELIVAIAIMAILTGAAVPVARVSIKRDKEKRLRAALWEMRDAIDRYKDAADRGAFQTKVGSENYPPDLETLVTGVDVNGKKIKFLRRIPVDPMTGTTEWGLRSMQDDPQSDSFGGQNVFDDHHRLARVEHALELLGGAVILLLISDEHAGQSCFEAGGGDQRDAAELGAGEAVDPGSAIPQLVDPLAE